jgi:hypothetical protein
MKNKLVKIWGIMLTLAILAGLLVTAVPVSAGTLAWTAVGTPSAFTTAAGPWVMAGAPDGKTFFAFDNNPITGNSTLYRSLDAGVTWTAGTVIVGGPIVAVAVSPDYVNDKWVVAATASNIYYSATGGGSLTIYNSVGNFHAGATMITSIDVGPSYLGGTALIVGTDAGASMIVIGGINASPTVLTGVSTLGVSLSPKYRTDAFLTFVTTNGTDAMVNTKWAAAAVNANYDPAVIAGVTSGTAVYAYPADFDRDGNNRFFVGTNMDVFRVGIGVTDNNPATPANSSSADLNANGGSTTANVQSVSFKGNLADGNLFAGTTFAAVRKGSTVGGTASWTGAAKISGSSNTFVFASPVAADTNVFAMTSGTGSAFQISIDGGVNFNQLSMIGSTTTTPAILDVAMIDANTLYAVLSDNVWTTLFKSTNAGTNWQGIYWATASPFPARIYFSPAYATDSTIYLTSNNNPTVLRSINAGISFSPTLNNNPVTTGAFAAVDANTYFTAGANTVYKVGAASGAALTGNVTSIVYVDATTLFAATDAGNVYLSTNSGTSFTKLGATIGTGATMVHPDVAYATNKMIHAANDGGIFTWTVDSSTAWTTVTTAITVDSILQGSEGTIYAGDETGAVTTPPTAQELGVARSLDTYAYIPGNNATSRLIKVLATGTAVVPDNTLYAIVGGNSVKTYRDILVTPPVQTTPAANSSQSINTPFSWVAVPNVPAGTTITYKIQVANAASFAPGTVLETITVGDSLTRTTLNAFSTNLDPGGSYWWKIRVELPLMSKYSGAIAFGVKPNENPGDIFQLLAPGPAAMDVPIRPTFQWSPVNTATGYDLQVADNPVFVNPIDSQTNLATTVWTLTKTLDYNKVYYWRVRAVNGNTGVVGDWVQNAFTTVALPPVTTSTPPPVITTFTFTTQPPATITFTTTTTTPVAPSTPAYIWVIIVIGAILVIAIIVLIARTRRV